MKRSKILFRVLIGLFHVFVIAVFVIPQKVLNDYELLFLWTVMPIVGWLWIRMLVDASKGN